ncbi:MAG: winged helix-turn-helix domain-containing protein [Acidobacteria bacterium]|nr:winged helix-turn-helix domain-containing protein [Acidobacteriota bacterium]
MLHGTKRLFRFGAFELDEETGELRKHGIRLSLQEQPTQLLIMLLDRPGELVTRREMQEQLWPDGTFVDFDRSLNTAINKVREVLADSASTPKFIETLARRGYRFLAPVETVDSKAPESLPASPVTSARTPALPTPSSGQILTSADELPQVSNQLARTLFVLLQIMYLCFYLSALAHLNASEQRLIAMLSHAFWPLAVLIISAAIGIPVRLFLSSAVALRAPGLRRKFLRLFPLIFPLDALWALSPFLLVHHIGFGLALASTAALLYCPFAQRSLILMGAGAE